MTAVVTCPTRIAESMNGSIALPSAVRKKSLQMKQQREHGCTENCGSDQHTLPITIRLVQCISKILSRSSDIYELLA